MASSYVDDFRPPQRHRRDRAPYPNDNMDDYAQHADPRTRPPPQGSEDPSANLPPPPMGDALHPKPALRREGSRSRLPPGAVPQFPDEASYLGAGSPDLERKTRPQDRAFRDMRDGYESDEGEAHRKVMGGGRRPRDDDPRGPPPRRRSRDRPPYQDESQLSRRRPDPYDEQPSRRSKRDPYYDDDAPSSRRRDRDRGAQDVEYGSAPVPARRRSEKRPSRRRDDYDDDSDDDDDRRPRRRRSFDDSRRPPPRREEDYYSDDRDGPRRRRDRDDHGDRRRDRSSRRRYDDDNDDYDRYDRRDSSRDRRRDKPPKEIKIGKYDVGPWLEKGQKHYATVAPILAPLVLNYARKHFMGGGGGGGGGGGSGGRGGGRR